MGKPCTFWSFVLKINGFEVGFQAFLGEDKPLNYRIGDHLTIDGYSNNQTILNGEYTITSITIAEDTANGTAINYIGDAERILQDPPY